MRWYLKWWMETEAHETFIKNIVSDLLKRQGLSVEEYCQNIVKPGWPLDKIGLVLFACSYKIHTCVFVEGKFWTTDREETIKSADIYLVYCGKLCFFDAVWKGSLSEGLFNRSRAVTYYLRSHSPEKEKIPHVTEPVSSRKTLNSLQAGLTKQSDLNKAFHEFKKLKPDVGKDYSQNKKLVKPKPSEKPHKTTESLEVKHHRIKKRGPQNHKFVCPVCK